MGNCQGKKAANVATTEKSMDVNTPKQVVESPDTQPATPEKETVGAALSVAQSAGTDDAVAVTVTIPQVASKDGTVFTTGAGTVVSSAESANEMPRTSTAKSAVSYAPTADETAVTTETYSYESPESNIQTMPTDFTEVERENSFLNKVDAFRDSCCGAGADGAAIDNNTSEAVESSPSISTTFSKAETEAPSTVVPVVSTAETEAAASAVGFSKSSSTASSAVTSSNDPNYKQKRKLTKKLREIEAIEAKDPAEITPDQQDKLAKKNEVLQNLAAL